MSKKPLDIIAGQVEYTPDFFDLKASGQRLFPVFVYDSLMRNKKNNQKFLEDAVYFGRGETIVAEYICKANDYSEGDPVAFKVDKLIGSEHDNVKYLNPMAGHIIGDVFGISLRNLTILDWIYDNTNIMQRHRMPIELTNKEAHQGDRYPMTFVWLGDRQAIEDCYGPIEKYTTTSSIITNGKRYYMY